jgi:DNA-binding beta-propeller fold protein YncE
MHQPALGPRRRRLNLAVWAAALAATVGIVLGATPARAAAPPLSKTRIVAHFDLAAGQQPENIALEPDGSADLTFSFARQVVRVTRTGHVRVLAQLPAPDHPATPLLGAAIVTGIARATDGTLYVGYATGTSDLTGIWRVTRRGDARRIAALPPNGLPNGLALDQRAGQLYVADSVLGIVWRICLRRGTPAAWATGPALQSAGFIGANGVKVRGNAVWVSNTDQGTVVRIPIRHNGSAGTITTEVSGLTGPDDFAFTGHRNDLLVTLNAANQVALVAPHGTPAIVLTAQDGLSNPTSVAVRHRTIYVPSAAYLTMKDPNLLLARLGRS